MATLILTTKLYIPPLPPQVVSRPRLIKQLTEGLAVGRKLTLISAAARFGKTTLVSEWIHQKDEGGRRKKPFILHPPSFILPALLG